MANIALITNNILSDSGTALTSVLTGSGTTNYLSKFTGSTALGNSLIYDDGTVVGIGVTGGVIFGATAGNVGTLQLTTTSQGSPISGRLLFGTDGSGWQFRIAKNTAGTISDLFTISDSGNVGIGTTSVGVKFVNSGGGNSSAPTLGSGTVGSQALLSANGLYGMYSGVSNSGDVWHQVQRNDGNTTVYNLLFQPSGGNVGIGTTSPLVALDVRGTVIITNQAGGNYNENLRLPESTSGYASLTLGGSIAASGTSAAQWTLVKFPTTNNFSIRNNNSDYVTVFPTGNFAIGTTTDAGYKLDVVNGAVRIVYSAFAGIEYHNTAGTWEGYIGTENGAGNLRYNSRQGAHTWYANSAANMKLTATGNLLIGTTTDNGYKLDVNGVIRAGSASSVSGSNILWGNYGNGALTTLGSMYSDGGPVLGYAVSPSTSGSPAFLSSTGITIARGAYAISGATHYWFGGSSQTVAIGSSVSMSEFMRIASTGNLLVGTSTDSGYKLDVNGTARINSTLALTSSTYAGTFSFYLSAANVFQASSSNIGVWLQVGGGNRVYIIGQEFNSTSRGNIFGNTVGGEAISATTIIAQSSGTTATTGLSLRYTINNTGTYSGISRGIYYNPTVTSLTGTTHRAIETVTGDVIFGSTSGNVGIGTTSPSEKLEVDGGSSSVYIKVKRDVGYALLGAGLNFNAIYSRDNSNNPKTLYIESANVLIGTTTDAGQKLQVNGSGNFNLGNSGYIKLQSGSGQRHGFVQSAYSNFLFSNNVYYDGSNWRYDQNGYGAQIQTETLSTGVIAFNTFASGIGGNVATIIESMRIVNNGNILMGTTSDSGHKLQVNGTSKFTDSIYLTGTNRFIASGSSSQSLALYGGSAYSDGAYFNVTGNSYGSSPGGGSAEFVIRTNSDSKFAMFGYNGSTWSRYMTLFGPTGNMNIGYGTSDLGYKFSVQGDAYITGTVIGSTALSTNNFVYANTDESTGGIFVYADITNGPNNLYSGGQIKANIYGSSLSTPTTVVPSTSQVLMSWYPTTTQGVFIDYTLWIDGPNARRSGTIMVVNDTSGNVQYTDTATIDLNASTSGVTLAAANNGGTMEVTLYNGTSNVVYINIITRYIPTIS